MTDVEVSLSSFDTLEIIDDTTLNDENLLENESSNVQIRKGKIKVRTRQSKVHIWKMSQMPSSLT